MAVRTATLRRDQSSGSWKARKAIPTDIREAYSVEYGAKHEAKFSASATTPERDARAVFAEWHATIEARFKGLRDKAAGKGQTLSHQQRFALIGDWHNWFAEQHAEPGKEADWEGYASLHFDAVAAVCQRFVDSDQSADLEEFDWAEHPQARPLVLAQVASAARVDAFLADKLEALAPESKEAFLLDLAPELGVALNRMKRRAGGDYSATVSPERFPTRNRTAGLKPTELFKEYVLTKKPAANTVIRWRSIFEQLDRFFPGRDAGSLTDTDAFAWREDLRKRLSDKSVNEQYVAAAKVVFNWALAERRLSHNPFASLKATQARRAPKTRERSFRDAELQTILTATLQPPPPRMQAHHSAARRWVPWLCFYSGARPGEICQLRKEDVIQERGRWALRLTPEAGTIKDKEARTVPLHEHLIEQGFIEFVKGHKGGALFFDPALLRRAGDDPTNPRRHPAEKVRMRLAEWIREIGVKDTAISPMHAFRNTWKTNALHAGIDKVVRDFVQGHAPETVGDAYTQLEGQKGFEILVRELAKYPRFEV